IYIAGHLGLVGSAILKKLQEQRYTNLLLRTHQELDLTRQKEVEEFFKQEKPEYVVLCAAKAGGIAANIAYKADFIYENLMIESNVIDSAYRWGCKKLLFIASTTIYPKNASLPTDEGQILQGDLEESNKSYAIAKIAGLRLCEAYNLQYGTNFLCLVPTNLYGNEDKFDFQKAHVLPALLRKFHLAKLLSQGKEKDVLKDLNVSSYEEANHILSSNGISKDYVEIWGSGKATREFLHSEDLARACVFALENINAKDLEFTHLNVGANENISIYDLAHLIKDIVGFKGELVFNPNKPDGVMYKLTDCSKMNALGWKSKISLQQGVTMMYEWYKKCSG
ncbi:MAG: GDP-L-fucose synthase, partial [Helicobacter sp.]|nr:GDP-L-fucose synthase [Helicobacter sp.]